MDCCNCISLDASLTLLFGVFVTILCAYLCHLCLVKWSSLDSSNAVATCRSQNCVRCNSNAVLQQTRQNIFRNYLKTKASEKLHRLQNAILSNATEKQTSEKLYVLFLSELSSDVWFDPEIIYKYDVETLENNFPSIFEEFWNVNNESGWNINENKTGCWRVFHLICQGKIIGDNASRCPKTMSVVQSMDHVMSNVVFGYVTFSVMEPGTVISPHYGSTNCRIRCHLGLQVDPDVCYLEAASLKKCWEAGKCLIFDDSFLHSAYHNGPKDSALRAVLMIDMWHPGLSRSEIDCISTVYSADFVL